MSLTEVSGRLLCGVLVLNENVATFNVSVRGQWEVKVWGMRGSKVDFI